MAAYAWGCAILIYATAKLAETEKNVKKFLRI